MLTGYCAGWSLRTLLHEGLNGVPGKVEAAPPKHLSSAIGQMVNFLGTLQNEWAGAQAFSSFDTYLAPFIRKDNLNVPSRWGTQTPFTNITFDWVCPDDLREQIPIIAGEEMPFSYGELQAEMDMINQAYIEVMTAGEITWQQALEHLLKRRGLLDAVVFSGGEPAIQPALLPAMQQTRTLGFRNGLHTGVPQLRRLTPLLPYLDWVGLDIKALPSDYELITTNRRAGLDSWAAIDALRTAGVDFECRLTWHGACPLSGEDRLRVCSTLRPLFETLEFRA